VRRRFILALLLAACLVAFFVPPAQAWTDQDTVALRGILSAHRSPLPPWTVEAFAALHPDFDVAGFLAVMWAESSLGYACDYKQNPGSIKGGPVGTVWRDLRTGVSPRGYNVYASIYDGQRAAIRLLYDRGYNAVLAAHDWWRFANRYYGAGVAGIGQYVANLKAAHAQLVKEAAQFEVTW
jgi:hypothetical protein